MGDMQVSDLKYFKRLPYKVQRGTLNWDTVVVLDLLEGSLTFSLVWLLLKSKKGIFPPFVMSVYRQM